MNRSTRIWTSAIVAAAIVPAANVESAGINYNASKSNTGNVTVQPANTCQTGQVWDAAAKKCVAIATVNNTTTRSNTQHNIMSTAPSGSQSGTPPK